MRIYREESILAVIDMQERLVPVMSNNEELVNKVAKLIEGCKACEVPVLVTQQYTKGLGDTIEPIKGALPPYTAIDKTAFSCCEASEFAEKLEKSSRKRVIICGIESHVCVLQTAIDLQESGFQPVVIKDCISSRNTDDMEVALNRFKQEGIIISTMESILFEFVTNAKDPSFKAISKLVK